MTLQFRGLGWTAMALLMGVSFAAGAAAAAPVHAVHPRQALYQREGCAACHQPDASGVAGVYPALAGRVARIAQSVLGRRYLVDVVAYGMLGTIEVDGQSIAGLMPPHPQLSDQDIAATLNWLAGLDRTPREKPVQFDASFVHKVREKPLSSESVYRMREDLLSARHDPEAHGGPEDDDPLQEAGARAKWTLNCAGCHGLNGEAKVPSVPAVRNAAGYFAQTTRGRRYLVRVPGASMSLLSDQDLATVMNWMLESFSRAQLPAKFKPYTASEVHGLRQHPLTFNAVSARAALVADLRERGVIPPATVGTHVGAVDGKTHLPQ